jgi:hypothetical protein
MRNSDKVGQLKFVKGKMKPKQTYEETGCKRELTGGKKKIISCLLPVGIIKND